MDSRKIFGKEVTRVRALQCNYSTKETINHMCTKKIVHHIVLITMFLTILSIPVYAKVIPSDKLAIEMMQWAVKRTVSETGTECGGIGSWISSKKYKGPFSGGTSDHDIRLIMPDGMTEKEMMEKWKTFRDTLKKNIAEAANNRSFSERIKKFKFKGNVTEMLEGATNVYPPNQIMDTLLDDKDAELLYKKYNVSSQSLGGGPVEGIYFNYSRPFKQGYEGIAGRHFYIDKKTGKVMAGGLDLEHMASGFARRTVEGETYMAATWRKKVLYSLQTGDLNTAKKQAQRLQESLKKARRLSKMSGYPSYLDDVISGATTDAEAIKIAMTKAQQEERVLAKLAVEKVGRNRALLSSLIEQPPGRWQKMWQTFTKYADKVPFDTLFQAFTVTMAYWATKDLSSTAAENAGETALKAYPMILSYVAPVPGLMVDLGTAVLMSAREGAYGIVTKYQDCDDLVAGIHTVKGREDAEATGTTIENMASNFTDTLERREAMRNFIHLQAAKAASRLEGGKWVEDPQITKRLVDKCEPQIIRMWQERRQSKIEEFNEYYIQFEKLMQKNEARIIITPEEIPLQLEPEAHGDKRSLEVIIRGGASVDMKAVNDVFAKMAATAKFLEGGKKEVLFLSTTNSMHVDGDKVDVLPGQEAAVRYVYDRPGEHTAELKQDIHLTNTIMSKDFEENSNLGKIRESTERAVIRIKRDAKLEFVVDDASLCIAGKERIRLKEKTILKALEPADGAACEKGDEHPDLEYVWTEEATKTIFPEKKGILDIKGDYAGTYKIKVEAYELLGDKKRKFGEARHTLTVGTTVAIDAPKNAFVGDTVKFRALVDMEKTGKEVAPIQYAWRLKGSDKVFESKEVFFKRIDYPGNYEFNLYVYQMVGNNAIKVGEAEHIMVVQQSTVSIEGPTQISIGENVTYTAKVSRPDAETGGFAKATVGVLSSIGKQLFGKDIMGSWGQQPTAQPYVFEWFEDGARTGSMGNSLPHVFTAKGSHVIKVVAYEDASGQRKKIGETTALVAVLEKKEIQQVAGKGMTLEIMMRRPECDNRSPVCTFEEEIVPPYPIRANYSVKFVPVVRYNGKPVRAFSHSDLYDCYIWSSEGKRVNNVGPYASYGWDRTGTHSIEVELKPGWCQQYMKGGNTKAKLTVQVGGQGVSLNPFDKLMQKTSPVTKQGAHKPSNKDVGSPSD